MLLSYTRGQGSVILRVKLRNSSVSTGAGLTGLDNTSTGLIISTIADNEATATVYTVAAGNVETITTLGTYAAPTAGKCRFREVDATNHPGVYEFQFADARLAVSNAKSLLVSAHGATNLAQCDGLVPLTDLDPYDTVRAGLTALPAAAADAAGGLPISDAGGLDLDAMNTSVSAILVDTNELQTDWANGGRLDLIIDAILVDTAEIGAAGAGLTEAGGTGDQLTAIPWNAAWDAEVQSEVDAALIAKGLDHLVFASVIGTDIADNSIVAKLVSSSAIADWDDFVNTTDSLQAIRDRGDASWITATGFSTHTAANVRTEMDANSTQLAAIVADTNELQTDWVNGGRLDLIIDAILVDTAEIGAAGAGLTEAGGTGDQLTAVPWNAAWDAEVQSEVDEALIEKGLDHLVFASVAGTDIADNSIVAKLASSAATADWDTFVNTTDSLQAIADSSAPTAAVIADAVWDELQADHVSAGSFGEIATEIASILVDTAEIGAAGAGLTEAGATGDHLTAVPWNAAWDAEVESEVDEALIAKGLDHLVFASVTGTDVADNSIVARLVSSSATADWDTFVNTTDSLQAIADSSATPPTAAVIADAVWDELQADHVAAGSFGEIATEIAAVLVDTAEIGAAGAGLTESGGTGDHLTAVPWNVAWDAEVQSEVDEALVALGLDHLLAASVIGADIVDNSIVARLASSAATADWDTFVNTTDSLQAIADSSATPPTAAVIADAVWDELQADHAAAGSFGEIATEIAAILVDTAEIGAAGAGLTEAGGTGDHLTAVPWNAAWDAEVQSEVDEALIEKGLDHLVFASVIGTDIADNSIVARLASSAAIADWDTFVHTTDSLQAIRDRGDTDWITATGFSTHTAANVRTEMDANSTQLAAILLDTAEIGAAGAGLTEAGGTGDHLTAVPWNAAWDAEVQSEVDAALSVYDGPTRAELTTDINSVLAKLNGLVIASGIIGATGNDTTHLHLDGLAYGDGGPNEHLIVVFDNSAGLYYSRWVSDFATAGDLATLGSALPVTPEASVDTYWLTSIRQDVTGGSGLDAAGVRAAVGLAAADLDTQLAAIESQTDDIGIAGAGLTAVPWNAAWSAEAQSADNDALVALGLDHLVSASVIGTDVADDSIVARLASSADPADWDTFVGGSYSLQALRLAMASGAIVVGTINDGALGSQAVNDIFSTVAITEDYAADGAAGTPAQILYLIQQMLTEFVISSTTYTVKKLDGSTTAATLTLNDADSPTGITRAT